MPPAEAALCTTQFDAQFMPAVVSGSTSAEPRSVRVHELGFGLPVGMSLPAGASSAARLGWMRVSDIGDAFTPSVGAPAADAGANGAGPSAGPELVILGPRELGAVPVSIGDTLVITHERHRSSSHGPWRARTVLERGDQLVFLSEDMGYGPTTFSGVTLGRGRVLCAEPYLDPVEFSPESFCAYFYHHDLAVTVPGGVTANLMPGETQTIGGYLVSHGSTLRVDTVPRTGPDDACADVSSGDLQATIVLSPLP